MKKFHPYFMLQAETPDTFDAPVFLQRFFENIVDTTGNRTLSTSVKNRDFPFPYLEIRVAVVNEKAREELSEEIIRLFGRDVDFSASSEDALTIQIQSNVSDLETSIRRAHPDFAQEIDTDIAWAQLPIGPTKYVV